MPSRALSRRDPPNGKNGFSIARRFTVIELMIAVAVFAIILSLALPSYRALIEKRQVTSGAEQVSAFLSAAQLEAVKRNREVAVTCLLESGGCVLVDQGNSSHDAVTLRNLEFANVKADVDAISYGGSDQQVAYDPIRGMMVPDDTVLLPLELQLSSAQDMYALNVRLLATGRVSVCSDANRADKNVPGYDICPVEELVEE
jgi:type IV fimbrial biogenesis protein FimT